MSGVLRSVLLSGALASFCLGDDAQHSVIKVSGPDDCDDDNLVDAKSTLQIHYTGFIGSSVSGEPGAVFDSSRPDEEVAGGRGQPTTIMLGVGHVLKGWDVGLVGLCKGTRVHLTLEPPLAFGEGGKNATTSDGETTVVVPGNATVTFDIEILDVALSNLFDEIDIDHDAKFDHAELRKYFAFHNLTETEGALDGMWERLDTDKNGFISWDEFDGPKGRAPPVMSEHAKDEL